MGSFNMTSTGSIRSALLPLNFSLDLPDVTDSKMLKRFTSQSCPRFIPSSRGQHLLFVAEHKSGLSGLGVEEKLPGQSTRLRQLAVSRLPKGEVIKSEASFKASWLSSLTGGHFQSSALQGNNEVDDAQ